MANCCKPGLYRPRRPRTSPLWRLLHRFFPDFLRVYEERYRPRLGCLRDVVAKRIRAFEDCGILERGLARLVCDRCGRELYVGFSCKGVGFCPSCQAKRRAELAMFLAEHVLEPVPHRHVVLSLPRRLRPFFLYDRSLLRELARAAWDTLKEILQTAAGRADAVPGAVVGIHSSGDLLDFHPHVHVLISWGVFTPEGTFVAVAQVPSKETLEKLFRHKVLRMLEDRGLIREDVVRNLLGWSHPGFGGYVSEKILPAPDPAQEGSVGFPERLLGYLVRSPVSLDRMSLGQDGSVLYRSDRIHPRHQANFRAWRDPLDFIAALVPHIAGVHERSTLYYGYYSNRARGERAKRASDGPCCSAPAPDRAPLSVRQAWARMLRKVFEVDPLACPCGGRLRVVAVIEDPLSLERILRHMGLFQDGLDEASGRAPPEAAAAEILVEPFLDDLAPAYDTAD